MKSKLGKWLTQLCTAPTSWPTAFSLPSFTSSVTLDGRSIQWRSSWCQQWQRLSPWPSSGSFGCAKSGWQDCLSPASSFSFSWLCQAFSPMSFVHQKTESKLGFSAPSLWPFFWSWSQLSWGSSSRQWRATLLWSWEGLILMGPCLRRRWWMLWRGN